MNVTEQAIAQLKKIIATFDNPKTGVHIFSAEGCCGPSIQMDIETEVGKDETILSVNDIDFFVSNDLLPQMENVTIEFGDKGFRLAGLQKSGGSCCG